MLRTAIHHFAQRKNTSFRIDQRIGSGVLVSFIWANGRSLVRGFIHQLLQARKPALLFLGKNVKITGRKQFTTGGGVRIGNNVEITAWSEDGIYIGSHAWIGAYSFLKASFSLAAIGKGIRIGNNVGIGEFAHLGGAGGLTIGNDCIIGPYFSCHPENHDFFNSSQLIRLQGTTRKGIHIGNNCWIGAKVTILDGVNIGDNCVLAAGAVVTKDLPANAVAGGVPARVLRYRTHDEQQHTHVA